MKTLAILGASGHGKVVADAALSSGLWTKVVFYDDAWPVKKRMVSQILSVILRAFSARMKSRRLLLRLVIIGCDLLSKVS